MVVSLLVQIDGKVARMAIITYSRKSVAETHARIQRYGRAIEHLSKFYLKMKQEGRATVTAEIFNQEYKREGYGKLLAARIKPHMNTCIHWSAMGADAILKLNRKYQISQSQAMALIYSVCAANSPDYFRVITNKLLEDEELANNFFEQNALYIAIEVYETIFDFKQEAARGKHKLPGQRHQPCGNRQASREAIVLSLKSMVYTCDSMSCFENKNKS